MELTDSCLAAYAQCLSCHTHMSSSMPAIQHGLAANSASGCVMPISSCKITLCSSPNSDRLMPADTICKGSFSSVAVRIYPVQIEPAFSYTICIAGLPAGWALYQRPQKLRMHCVRLYQDACAVFS